MFEGGVCDISGLVVQFAGPSGAKERSRGAQVGERDLAAVVVRLGMSATESAHRRGEIHTCSIVDLGLLVNTP
jgi:hypothetical protein